MTCIQKSEDFIKILFKEKESTYISFKAFKELYPLIIFDLRPQKDVVSSQSVQARFRFPSRI